MNLNSHFAKTLNEHLALMRSLDASLERSRNALLASDPRLMELCTQQQLEICAQLRETLDRLATEPVNNNNIDQEDQRLLTEIRQLASEVHTLNLQYATLLSKKRRTLDIVARMLASSAVTYEPSTSQLRTGGATSV